MISFDFLPALGIIVAAAILSAVLTRAIRPLLVRYALAKPNARSSHIVPTPQGAGIAVTLAVLMVAATAAKLALPDGFEEIWIISAAAILLAITGAIDDLRAIPVMPRLTLQTLAVAAVILTAPDELRIVPQLPLWIERGGLVLAGVWFVNLVNFMDGLDWMTVAEVIPITGAIVLLGLFGQQAFSATLIAASLGGAMVGFAPFNRPVAKVFLGDVGSLPIGLLLGWCLLQLAYEHLAAAVLLPLYYLIDTAVTLLRRLARGEPIWKAHRQHFYQRATDNGWTVLAIVRRVFSLNILLVALSVLSVWLRSTAADIVLFALGVIAVMRLLSKFAVPRA